MDKETLRRVQLVQLEMAKEIKRVCEESDITYWLDGGTLIGAIRHDGFIPWDDDLDIGMLRKDYDKFLEIAPKKLSKKYELITWENEKNYPHAFSKIQKIGTVYQEERAQMANVKNGIWVDIFPFDPLPDGMEQREKIGKKLTFAKTMLRAKCKFNYWNVGGRFDFKKWMIYAPFRTLSILFRKEALISMYMKQVQAVSQDEKTTYLAPQGASTFGRYKIPSDCFSCFEKHAFEDDFFMIPSEYDKYLTAGYGDYMKLPPEEERYVGHSIVAIDFGEE